MKLWLLKARKGADPFESWYDKAFSFVIRAETEEAARLLTEEKAGDEGKQTWLNNEYTSCSELTTNGPAEVILVDFNSA